MRLIIQRVTSAKVEVDGEVVSEIGRGLFVLVGITTGDTATDAEYLRKKLLGIRLWEDDAGKSWARSVVDQGYELLLVSQFTLFGTVTKGTKPDFHMAMTSAQSKDFYADFVASVGKAYDPSKVKDGRFGAMMACSLTNDGPVTLQVDSRKYTYDTPANEGKGNGKSSPATSSTPKEAKTPDPTANEPQ